MLFLLWTVFSAKGGVSASGMHSLAFSDGALILSKCQFSRLGLALQTDASTLPELISLLSPKPVLSMRSLMAVLGKHLPTSITPRVEPCAWNMMLSRRCVVRNCG